MTYGSYGSSRPQNIKNVDNSSSGGANPPIDTTDLAKDQTLLEISTKIDILEAKVEEIHGNFFSTSTILGNLAYINNVLGDITNDVAPDSEGFHTLASLIKRFTKLSEQSITAEVELNAPSQEIELRNYPNLFEEGYACAIITVGGNFTGIFEIVDKPFDNDPNISIVESYNTNLKAIGNAINSNGLYLIQGDFKNLFIRNSPSFTGSAKIRIVYSKNSINTPDLLAPAGILSYLLQDLQSSLYPVVAAVANHTRNTPVVLSNFGFNAANQSIALASQNQFGENINEYSCGTLVIANSVFTGSISLKVNPYFQSNILPINPVLTIPVTEVSTGKVVTAITAPGYYRFPGNLRNLMLQTSGNFTGSIANIAVMFNQYKIYDVSSNQSLDALNIIKDRLMPSGSSSQVFRNNGAIGGIIKNSAGRILSISAINQSSTIKYLQIFDSNQAPANNAPAVDIYPLYALSNNQPGHLLIGQDILGGEGDFYSNGIAYGISNLPRIFNAATVNDCLIKARFA